MTLIDLFKAYRCYNDLEIIVCDSDNNEAEIIAGDEVCQIVYGDNNAYLDKEVLGMRAVPYQSEENAYFMDSEMRIMVKAKVKVWVR